MFIPFMKLNAIGIKSSDKLNAKIVKMLKNLDNLEDLTSNVFVSNSKKKINLLSYKKQID